MRRSWRARFKILKRIFEIAENRTRRARIKTRFDIDAEAKEKQCDFVIYAQVSHKKGGGGGMFGKMLSKASETVAGRAYGSSDTAASSLHGQFKQRR
jgi:hypothetical protein